MNFSANSATLGSAIHTRDLPLEQYEFTLVKSIGNYHILMLDDELLVKTGQKPPEHTTDLIVMQGDNNGVRFKYLQYLLPDTEY